MTPVSRYLLTDLIMKGSIFAVSGALLCFVIASSTLQNQNQIWKWKCNSEKNVCTRNPFEDSSTNETLYPSIEVCRLICGKYGALWPQPRVNCTLGKDLFKFGTVNFSEISLTHAETKNFLQQIVDLFQQYFSSTNTASCPEKANVLTVSITVVSNTTILDWHTNEAYHFGIKEVEPGTYSAEIVSTSVFGARHALETLSQLVDAYPNDDGSTCLTVVNEATIIDSPYYPHRGLLLDTTRNFQSITTIKKHINAMAASKLNVLHWHITDTQSFPLELPNLPNMTKFGAYSADKIYHTDEIKELLSYARLRGVRIIIEIDAPAHAGNGWQWGPDAGLGNLAVCVNQQPWRSFCIQPPCGQLNPINKNLYTVLKILYNDTFSMLPKGEVFHMGGDEVFIPCWNSTPEILKYLWDKPRTTETFLDLWAAYQDRALSVFDEVVGNTKTPIILWTSHLTNVDVIEKYLSKDRYVIQTWVPASDDLPEQLLALGYRLIVSTKDAWYLDHGFWGSTVYHNWVTVYNNKIGNDSKTLGGEVCMWGEYVDDSSVESRAWPRAAAAAERLWSNPSDNVNTDTRNRFFRHRERLVARGTKAEALIPKWCYQNEGEC